MRREGRKAAGRKDLELGGKREHKPESEEGKEEIRREGRKIKKQKSKKGQTLKGRQEIKVAGVQEERLGVMVAMSICCCLGRFAYSV